MIHEDNYITFKCIYQLSQKYKFEKINIFLVMIIKDGSYKQIETRGRQTIAYNIFVKSKHSCRQMRKFNHIRSNRKCFIYKLILNILSYRENEILDFPLFPVKLVDGDLKYEVVQNFYSKISGTVNYANTSCFKSKI